MFLYKLPHEIFWRVSGLPEGQNRTRLVKYIAKILELATYNIWVYTSVGRVVKYI